MAQQLVLPLPATWGGRRKGAGRKPAPGPCRMPHRARPVHDARHPVHVTLRSTLTCLRSQFVFPTIRAVFLALRRRRPEHFRIVAFSVQGNHLHLVVEASSRAELSSGLRSLTIRLAQQVNRLLMRKGQVCPDRWHGRALTTPRAVRHALVYVLGNFTKHSRKHRPGIDPCSSAPYFTGFIGMKGEDPLVALDWRFPRALAPPRDTLIQDAGNHVPVEPARTWLLSTGWRRCGLLGIGEGPRS